MQTDILKCFLGIYIQTALKGRDARNQISLLANCPLSSSLWFMICLWRLPLAYFFSNDYDNMCATRNNNAHYLLDTINHVSLLRRHGKKILHIRGKGSKLASRCSLLSPFWRKCHSWEKNYILVGSKKTPYYAKCSSCSFIFCRLLFWVFDLERCRHNSCISRLTLRPKKSLRVLRMRVHDWRMHRQVLYHHSWPCS